MFGLSPVITLGLKTPRKKERKKAQLTRTTPPRRVVTMSKLYMQDTRSVGLVYSFHDMCHSLHPIGGDTRSTSNDTVYPFFLVSSHIPLREASAQPNCCVALRSVNSQPWRFTNNSLGLPYAHSLSVCLYLWVCVVCACFLLYLSVYLRWARGVFCVLFYICNHLFVFFLLFLQALGMTLLEVHWILHVFYVRQEDGGGVNRGS